MGVLGNHDVQNAIVDIVIRCDGRSLLYIIEQTGLVEHGCSRPLAHHMTTTQDSRPGGIL